MHIMTYIIKLKFYHVCHDIHFVDIANEKYNSYMHNVSKSLSFITLTILFIFTLPVDMK